MADYRDHHVQISAAGASVTAVSVDTAAESERLRAQLSLPFRILCDVKRRVIREWDLLNAQERGGIAKPAVFVIDPGLKIRYAAVDTMVSRVRAAEVIPVLEADRAHVAVRRKTYLPFPGDWMRAIRNSLRKA